MKHKRNQPCPCGSRNKYKNCHGGDRKTDPRVATRDQYRDALLVTIREHARDDKRGPAVIIRRTIERVAVWIMSAMAISILIFLGVWAYFATT